MPEYRLKSPQQHLTALVAATGILCGTAVLAGDTNDSSRPWPGPVPCRIQDGTNRDLLVMTLGRVETPLADGIFDPVKDEVKLKDGGIKEDYYRDALGVKYYQPLDKSRFPLPPSGWCTWYFYYSRITATEVRRNADWIAANLKDYGAKYVQIDDGWQGAGGRDGGRDWTKVNPDRFPLGMAELAAHIKSVGLTPGLWLASHGQSNPQVVTNKPGVFLLKPDGSSASDTWEGRFLVDGSAPAAAEYMKDLFTRLSGWGFEYFKIDGQPIVVDEYGSKKQFLKNPSDDAAGLYRTTLESIRTAIGPDRYLLGCWGTPIEGAGIMNGSRTGGDVVLGWGGFHVALRATLQGYYLHNIVWYSDPDVLLVRSPLTLDQARVWAAVYGLTGQALMASDRLMDLSEDRVELLKRVYPATDVRPLDLFPIERDKRIWDLKINHLGRNYDVVGVFNFNEGKSEQTFLNWKDLGLPVDRPIHVFDFWNKEYLGAWSGGMMVDAAPTSCRLLTLLPDNGHIQLISTSRHITQGWVDLSALSWNEAGTSYKGSSKVVKEDPYELRFAFPRGTNFAVKRAEARGPSGRLPVKIFNHQGWAAVQMTSPKNGQVNWEVEFEPADLYQYPVAAPEGVYVERAGLDGVNLHWREQYYLNAGYQVYLNGSLVGYTPDATFALRGLDSQTDYTAEVKTVWEDGKENARGRNSQAKFTMAALVPAEISLTQIEPARSNARWRGFELDERLSGAPLSIGGKRYEKGLAAAANSEIEFDLRGLYDKFTALAGVDGGVGADQSLEFFVTGDGKELWSSGALKKPDDPRQIDVDITGVHKLTLRVTGPNGRRNRAQADWVEPKITRNTAPAK
jgi:hypothetical protein